MQNTIKPCAEEMQLYAILAFNENIKKKKIKKNSRRHDEKSK